MTIHHVRIILQHPPPEPAPVWQVGRFFRFDKFVVGMAIGIMAALVGYLFV